jgi:hypothetical protein
MQSDPESLKNNFVVLKQFQCQVQWVLYSHGISENEETSKINKQSLLICLSFPRTQLSLKLARDRFSSEKTNQMKFS